MIHVVKEEYKKMLEQQLQLLSEKSRGTYNNEDVCKLTDKMINLVQILDPELQNQSFYAASTNHQYVVQLPVKDLVDLYAARAEVSRNRYPYNNH